MLGLIAAIISSEIIVAVVMLIGTVAVSIINSMSIKSLTKKLNDAESKKTNAEADTIIFELKNKSIKDLQDQINELRKEIESLKKQEHIHILEKVRLEQQIADLKSKNAQLMKRLKSSDAEIINLTNEIEELRQLLNKINTGNQ